MCRERPVTGTGVRRDSQRWGPFSVILWECQRGGTLNIPCFYVGELTGWGNPGLASNPPARWPHIWVGWRVQHL